MDTSFVYSYTTNEPSTFTKFLPFITLFIGAIITLIITQITKYCTNKAHRKKTKQHLIHSIESLIFSINRQNDCLIEYIEQLNKKPSKMPLLKRKSGFHFKSIDIIPEKDIFDIFVLQEKEEKNIKESELRKFIDIIEAIRSNKETLFKYTDKILKDNNEYIRNYNILYTQIMDITKVYGVDAAAQLLNNPLDFKEDPLLSKLNYLMTEFHINHETFTLFEVYKSVILPAFSFASIYREKEIYKLLHECYHNLFDFVNERDNYLSYLKEQLEDFQESIERLNDTINLLKK